MTAHKPTTVPRLRFPEFQDAPDWKTGRCRDIAKVLPGYGFPDKFQGNKKGQYPFYKVSDISHTIEKGQRYISEANNYIDSDVLDTIRGKSVPAGTIIFAKIGEAIRSNRRVITTKPAVIDNNTAGVKALKAKSFDEFLFYLWSNVSLIDHAGGVVPAVSKSALESVPLCYPSDPAEQQRIADCLSSLDDLIAADGRKLEALRQHKQGLMQQLFPQPGETVPRLRFPEFQHAGGWKEKQLGKMLKIGNGRDHKYLSEGEHPVYGTGGYMRSVNDYLHDGESVSIGRKGTIDKPMFLEGKFWTVDTLFFTHSFKDCLPKFVYLIFQNIPWQEYNAASGVPSLSKTTIEKIEVFFPKVPEQQKVADCLGSLDDLIAAEGRKLEALRQHKQGLMQQLFPSLDGQ